ncbi:MAG: diaminopimelate decarboxylase [Arenicella sp.]
MDHFNYRDGILHAEDLAVNEIIEQVDTPCYIYSRATLERHWHAFNDGFSQYPHLVCFAVKANSNLGVLSVMAKLGSGFDIVSGGELQRVIAAGGDPSKTVFSGVAKSEQEIAFALEQGILSINIESSAELERIQSVAAAMNVVAPISVRVNPDVDAQTHPYISTGLEEAKFGIPMQNAVDVYQTAHAMPNIRVHGVACHIGSQITTTSPFVDALLRLIELVKTLEGLGIEIKQLDLGGGLGIPYHDETPPSPAEYIQTLQSTLHDAEINIPISIEPGRAIAGNAGILVTKVEYLKANSSKRFAIVDAGMNDLMRPALYQAWHDIIPVVEANDESPSEAAYDVVGPVCETTDILGKSRNLRLQADDLLAIRSTGAYGFVMSSNYNTRPKPPEVLVDRSQWHLVRRRETTEELFATESVCP